MANTRARRRALRALQHGKNPTHYDVEIGEAEIEHPHEYDIEFGEPEDVHQHDDMGAHGAYVDFGEPEIRGIPKRRR